MNRLEADLAELGLVENEPQKLPPLKVVARQSDKNWERCKPWIEAGLQGSLLSVSDVEAQLKSGTAILWPGEKCAIVTEFVDYSSGERAAQVMSAGGDMQEIIRMIPGMEAYGRLNGCSRIIVTGRLGWQRMLKSQGYDFLSVTVGKAL